MAITRKMLNKCPSSRWQNWWSDVAFLIVIGRFFQICGSATRKVQAAVTGFVDRTINKALFEDRRNQPGSRWWVHINTVVVDEFEPCKSSQQSCTEFVVGSATNVVLYKAVEINWDMVHCTPLTQVNFGHAVNGWQFCSLFRIALHYSSRVEKRQSSKHCGG